MSDSSPPCPAVSPDPVSAPSLSSQYAPKAPVAIIRDQAVQSSWLEHDTKSREMGRKAALAEVDADDARARRLRDTPELNGWSETHTRDLGRPTTNPVVILQMITADGRKEQFCQCDWTVDAAPDGTVESALNLICPRCVARGVPQAQAQVRVSDRNKRVSLDITQKGTVWVDPDTSEAYTVAGVVTLDEWSSCPRPGCGFKFRIDPRSSMLGVSRLRSD